MNVYSDEDLLLVSGIQHFAFCERQWALIHVETQWAENVSTIEGKQLHERVDDPFFTEKRNEVKVVRSTPLLSRRLGLYGIADVIEYVMSPNSRSFQEIRIVEYKRGRAKPDDRDEVQLCAQGMCLEEMLGVNIERGFLFYGETRRRQAVIFDEQLRERVASLADRMHLLFKRGITPVPTKSKKCNNCSLSDLCLPYLDSNLAKASNYLHDLIKEINREATGD